MTLPKGPSTPKILQSLRIQKDPLKFLRSGMEKFGDTYTIRIVGMGDVVVLTHPDAIQQVFTQSDTFYGGAGQELIEPMVGRESIFLSDADDHRRKRQVMVPAFHRKAIERYTDQIQAIAAAQAARWPRGEAVSVRPGTQTIAMDVILQIIFGLSGERLSILRDRLTAMRDLLNAVIMFPALRRDFGPWSPWPRFVRRRALVDEFLFEELAARRDHPELADKFDFMSLLLQATDEDGKELSDHVVRDQLISMVVAGYETTAVGLAWALEMLARHPDVVAKLREGDPDYMSAVIDETLRLYPPVFHVARRVIKDTEIGGYAIPEGSWVMVAILLLHRRPEIYPDPDEFRPERFETEHPPRNAYAPFSGGSRTCLGLHLAKLEMSIVLDHVVRNFDLAPASPTPETIKMEHIVAVPRNGAKVIFTPR